MPPLRIVVASIDVADSDNNHVVHTYINLRVSVVVPQLPTLAPVYEAGHDDWLGRHSPRADVVPSLGREQCSLGGRDLSSPRHPYKFRRDPQLCLVTLQSWGKRSIWPRLESPTVNLSGGGIRRRGGGY